MNAGRLRALSGTRPAPPPQRSWRSQGDTQMPEQSPAAAPDAGDVPPLHSGRVLRQSRPRGRWPLGLAAAVTAAHLSVLLQRMRRRMRGGHGGSAGHGRAHRAQVPACRGNCTGPSVLCGIHQRRSARRAGSRACRRRSAPWPQPVSSRLQFECALRAALSLAAGSASPARAYQTARTSSCTRAAVRRSPVVCPGRTGLLCRGTCAASPAMVPSGAQAVPLRGPETLP